MKVHPLIVSAAITVVIALQAWTLMQVADLRVTVAVLSSRIDSMHGSRTAKIND
jgi:hypothetical protein